VLSGKVCRWFWAHGVTTGSRQRLLFNNMAMVEVGVGRQRKRLVGVDVTAINVLDSLA
jgi:hypothetical protein